MTIAAAAQGAAVLLPEHDNNTWRAGTVPVTNGQTMALKVAVTGQGNARSAFFKFTDFSAAVGQGNDATFTMVNSGAPAAGFALTLFALNPSLTTGYDWSETTIEWASSPAYSSSGTNFLNAAAVTNLGSFSIPLDTVSGTSFSTSFSNWQNYLQIDGSLTLIAVVTSQSGGTGANATLNIGSAENTNPLLRPTLTIVPEPASAVLCAFGSLLLFAKRRR